VALAGLLVGLAVMCVAFFGESMRHFGGTHQVGQGNSAYRCAAWWAQVGSAHGELDADEGPSPRCRAAAARAVPTIVWQSGVAGVLGLVVAGAAMQLRRRRSADQTLA
jgi:uncharacterized protein (TIGR03382 family)